MTALPEGFIAHDGGPCPVQGRVHYILRSGWIPSGPGLASMLRWCHHPEGGSLRQNDIIAYRLPEEPNHDAD